ncbi:MAG TPA: hypothetical protein VF559_05595 [Caulobacteraceae bacterium]|jgi:hypothetical protein
MSLTDDERRANAEWTARARALGPNSVLLYSCANAPYQDFVPLFAFSGLALDSRFIAEAGVQDAAAFAAEHGPALDLIEQTFPDRFTWRAVPWKRPDGTRLRPHVVRFVTPPQNRAEYVFISDVDFVFLNPELIDQHFRIMGRLGLPYSNSIRPGTRRMSGLHFTRWDALYPLPDLSGLDLHHANDEENLAAILERKGLPLQDRVWERPSPGVHISPSRDMNPSDKDGRRIPGWSWQPFAAEHQAFWSREDAKALRPLLSDRLRAALAQLDEAVAAHLEKLRRRERRAVREAQPRPRQHREGHQ